MNIEPVAYFSSPLREKFGIPRQSGLAPSLKGEVRFVPPYDSADALRGLEGFDYVWLLWEFSLNGASRSLTVRPPRLGGNERVGVFASRSPFRPNPLGLSCVKLESVEPGCLRVSGADLADGTPIYDVKPYVEYADSRPGARCGFTDAHERLRLSVELPEGFEKEFPQELLPALVQIIEEDPRPAYQDDPARIYGVTIGEYNVRFRVEGGVAKVLEPVYCQ